MFDLDALARIDAGLAVLGCAQASTCWGSGCEMTETQYDMSGHTPVTEGPARDASVAMPAADGDGMDCHAGAETMAAAARVAGNSEFLDQYAADYPVGPDDKPQSMCPAFGSLRVGLRMWRVATVLSGSACCVYGLTFVSHFYGARRSVGYVPFNSESLVTVPRVAGIVCGAGQ